MRRFSKNDAKVYVHVSKLCHHSDREPFRRVKFQRTAHRTITEQRIVGKFYPFM